MTTDMLTAKLNLSKSQISRYLKDMQEFRMVQKNSRPNNSGIRGRNSHYWVLTKQFKILYKSAMTGASHEAE
jgi:DNA-binding transcriptional regulator GbsR (MarR family)